MRVLAISGSLRAESWNTTLLRAAGEMLAPGHELVLHENLKAIPPFDEDDEHDAHGTVHALRDAVRAADVLLFATPEYNHSIPGQLKNAIDWISRPTADPAVRGKRAAVVGASTGLFGAVWAQADLRRVLAAAGAAVLDRELPVGQAAQHFDASGRLTTTELRAEFASMLDEVTSTASTTVAAAI